MNLTLQSAEQLRDYLNDLNWNGSEASGVAIVVADVLWLAYCTDPDGEWYFESGDPEDRMSEDAEGWREYARIGFDWVGPMVDHSGAEILWPRATAEQLAQAEVDRLLLSRATKVEVGR